MYWQSVCQTIWNVMSDKKRQFSFGQSEDRTFCALLVTCLCNVWRITLSRICQIIRRHFKHSLNTLIQCNVTSILRFNISLVHICSIQSWNSLTRGVGWRRPQNSRQLALVSPSRKLLLPCWNNQMWVALVRIKFLFSFCWFQTVLNHFYPKQCKIKWTLSDIFVNSTVYCA